MIRTTPKGFTLVEAMITVTVLAVVAAITIPKITETISSIQLASAAEKLVSDLKYDKQSTKRTLTTYPASFSAASGRYSIPLSDPMGPSTISGPLNGCTVGWTGTVSFDVGGTPRVNGALMTNDLSIPVRSRDGTKTRDVVVLAYNGDIGAGGEH